MRLGQEVQALPRGEPLSDRPLVEPVESSSEAALVEPVETSTQATLVEPVETSTQATLVEPVETSIAVDPETAHAAARTWIAGGLVALPTETVYGLAADAQNPEAVARIYTVKGRPADHPLIVHVGGEQALDAWSDRPDPRAHALAAAFWPGPLTLVVRRSARAGDHITGGQDTVALRSPGHPVALACLRALAELTGDPARGVAAPSANRFGRVSPTTAADVLAELGPFLIDSDLILDGGASAVGVESTIVDCTAELPRVLRPGAVSQADIDLVLSHAGLLPDDGHWHDESPDQAAAPRAPGTLDAHYAPDAAVLVVAAGEPLPELPAGEAVGLIALREVGDDAGWTRLATPADVAEYAHQLYGALRRADRLGLAQVVAVLPPSDAGSLADAVADRLARAAHGGRTGSSNPAPSRSTDP